MAGEGGGILLGALEFALKAIGVETVQQALQQIDAQAKKAAASTGNLHVKAPGAKQAADEIKMVEEATKRAEQATKKAGRTFMDTWDRERARTEAEVEAIKQLDAEKANAKQKQREINQEIQAELAELAQLARQTDVTSAHEVERFQKAAAAAKEWMAQQNASTQQMIRLDSITAGLNQRVERLGTRGARSARLMAGSMAVLAASSFSSVRAMDSLLANASLMAFSFGDKGEVVGAALVAGSVLTRLFLDIRKQMMKTEEEAEKQLKKLEEKGNAIATEAAIRKAEKHQALLNDQITKLQTKLRSMDLGSRQASALSETILDLQAQLNAVNAQVQAMTDLEAKQRREDPASIYKEEASQLENVVAAGVATEAQFARLRTIRASLMEMVHAGTLSLKQEASAAEILAGVNSTLDSSQKKTTKSESDVVAELVEAHKLHAFTAQDLRDATGLEIKLTAELDRGNLSRKRRADILKELDQLHASGTVLTPGLSAMELMPSEQEVNDMGAKATAKWSKFLNAHLHVLDFSKQPVPNYVEKGIQGMLDKATASADQQFQQFGANIGALFTEALGDALTPGFRNVGKVVLSGMGDIFERMGAALIRYGLIVLKLLPALKNPFTSGPAALVAGGLLIALGASLGAIAGGTGASGVGHDRADSAAVAAGGIAGVGEVTRPAGSVTVSAPVVGVPVTPVRPIQIINPVFLSERSPEFQAIIANTYNYADGRGLIRRSA